MTAEKLKERKARIARMERVLKKLYPGAKIALNFSNDWELLVAVELSAQCTDKMVNKVTEKLFKKYKTLNDYCNATQKEFEQDIHATGFFRNKAKNILAAAKLVQKRFGGAIPKTMEEMLTIPGVARKTANVVLSNAHGLAFGIAVDTHIKRFTQRFDLSDYKDPVRIERDLMEILPKREWNTFTYRLINYGREICPARPHPCEQHPLTYIYPKAAHIWPKAK
jgi:endonuclease-3